MALRIVKSDELPRIKVEPSFQDIANQKYHLKLITR